MCMDYVTAKIRPDVARNWRSAFERFLPARRKFYTLEIVDVHVDNMWFYKIWLKAEYTLITGKIQIIKKIIFIWVIYIIWSSAEAHICDLKLEMVERKGAVYRIVFGKC